MRRGGAYVADTQLELPGALTDDQISASASLPSPLASPEGGERLTSGAGNPVAGDTAAPAAAAAAFRDLASPAAGPGCERCAILARMPGFEPPICSRPCAALPVAIREVRGFPARLFPALPAPSTLALRSPRGLVAVTTSRAAYGQLRAAGVPVFVGGELLAIALAAEHDRASPASCAEWIERKRTDPDGRLSPAHVLGGVDVGASEPADITLGRVLDRCGVELIGVECDDDLPIELQLTERGD